MAKEVTDEHCKEDLIRQVKEWEDSSIDDLLLIDILPGEVMIIGCDKFLQLVEDLVHERQPIKLAIDVANARVIDSRGLGTLIHLANMVGIDNFCIVHARQSIVNVMTLLHMLEYIRCIGCAEPSDDIDNRHRNGR